MRKNKTVPNKEVDMTSIADVSVFIETSSKSVPSTPSWFGEVALIIPYLGKQGVLNAISGERTLEGFYERLLPLAHPFMALFDRERLPSRSALSRFLASLTWEATEALRTLFLADLLARPLDNERHTGTLVDRAGNERVVFDIDGTREAARQRALPKTEELPAPQRRLIKVCAPGYTGRKRGEVVRTRTVVSQAHSYHWLGNFGNRGNGRYREELRRGLVAIRGYLEAHHLSPSCALLRLDGQYGTGAVIADLAGFSFVMRGKDYTVLDRPEVQSRLHLPADQQFSRSESGLVRQLYDCPDVPVGPEGVRCRVVVATHPAAEKKSRIGHTRQGVVYELFFTHLPQDAFTASDVVALYLHRGAFETVLADEDQEQDPDRWCSHAPAGQEAWQIVSQWVWNLRLELGHVLEPTPMRTTEFAPPVKEEPAQPVVSAQEEEPAQPVVYGPPQWARPSFTKGFAGADFRLLPDGTLRCPAGRPLYAQERRPERNGSLRVLYAARIGHCRSCPLREQCQESATTIKARRVSAVCWPVSSSSLISGESSPASGESSPIPAPHAVLWGDWQRRFHRRELVKLLGHQRVDVRVADTSPPAQPPPARPFSRAQRAHYRLSWAQRLARNAAPHASPSLSITLFGIPDAFAQAI